MTNLEMPEEVMRSAASTLRQLVREVMPASIERWYEPSPDLAWALRENLGTTTADADATFISVMTPELAALLAGMLNEHAYAHEMSDCECRNGWAETIAMAIIMAAGDRAEVGA